MKENINSFYLGTDYEGCGYDNNGFKYYGTIEKNFGDVFTVGDVIRCCIDLKQHFIISYLKNGLYIGTAYRIPDKYMKKAFYPHICLRNMVVEFNFGAQPDL